MGDPTNQQPSVGRMVHYVAHGTPIREDGTQAFPQACRSATVTEVDLADPTRVGLMVANPTGLFFHPLAAGGCVQHELPPGEECTISYRGGSWHWHPDDAPEGP